MDILLDDDEIPYKPDGEKEELYCDIGARDKSIYLEGAKAQLKKLVDYMDSPCTHELGWIYKWSCPLCRDAVKEEA